MIFLLQVLFSFFKYLFFAREILKKLTFRLESSLFNELEKENRLQYCSIKHGFYGVSGQEPHKTCIWWAGDKTWKIDFSRKK